MLFINRYDLDAVRQFGLQLVQPRLDRSADLDYVAVDERRDPEGESPRAIVAHDLARSLRLLSNHAGDVVERNLPNFSGSAEPQRLNALDADITWRNGHSQSRQPFADLAVGENLVFVGDDTEDLVRWQPQFGQARRRDRDDDLLFRQPLNLDLGHPVDGDKAAPQFSREFTLGRGAQPIGRHSVEHAVDVAEIVVDDRRLRTGGELSFDVADTAAHLVPDLRDLVGPIGHLDLDRDLGHARHGFRFHPVELLHLLECALHDIGDFLFHFHRGRARIGHENERRLERETRVFEASDRVQSPQAADKAKDNCQPNGDRTSDACA